jgi:Fe-S oxidoreductase
MELFKEVTEEELKRDILDASSYCILCRFCLPVCPLYRITLPGVTQGGSGITQALYHAVKWEIEDKQILNELRDLLFACTSCKACEIDCAKFGSAIKLVDVIEKGKQILLEEMIGPMPDQKSALESLERYTNPYGMPPSERKDWLKGLNAPIFSQESEVLFFVGCTAPHDAYAGNMAKALVKLLKAAKVKFGIIEDELCCGNPSLKMGERLLFEDICERNLDLFKSLGVKHIVTLSPHCFDIFKNRCPEEAMQEIRVQHYTQFLTDLIDQKKLTFSQKIDKKVTYQDPCYLGRHNDVYDEPRKILQSIPGIKLIEFSKCRADSVCCGGGGGRMWSDFESEIDRIANLRVKEALDIGVDMIMTACPWCYINIVDGVKSVNVEDKLKVKDIAELCAEVL